MELRALLHGEEGDIVPSPWSAHGWKDLSGTMTVVNVMHQVTDHARQLLEKHFRQPFLNLDYGPA